MGTLDDAIREHLELKRRAGATADEVRRLESEALGPARRDAAAPEAPEREGAGDDAVLGAEPVARERDVGAAEPDPEPVRAPEPEATRAPAAEPAASAPPVSPDPVDDATVPDLPRAEPAPGESDATWLEEDPFGDAGPDPSTTGNPSSDYVAPDDEGEDLLEETPDFLQETPEHDRLWFEQKPPRDFDFDN